VGSEFLYAIRSIRCHSSQLGDTDLCALALPLPTYEQTHTYAFGALATSRYLSTTFKTVDRTIDFHTGLASQDRDIAERLTTLNVTPRPTPSSQKAEVGAW